jgi:biotin carboxyl carrier protein
MTKRLLITIDGKQYDVLVEVLDDAGRPAVPAPAPAAPAGASAGPGDIPSPLTGRVVAINVQVGQTVKAGDCVLVLEAMKMNTNVFAPRDGVVKAIKVAVGDAAEEGQPLMTLE